MKMLFQRIRNWFRSKFREDWKLKIIDGDSLPERIPKNTLILAREGDEDWCAGMLCPCGCGEVIELMLIPEATPHWRLIAGPDDKPSLKPSVWRITGCRSHFWLRRGNIEWCEAHHDD